MRKGLISFAGSGPNSRWGELFFSTAAVNLGGGAWEVNIVVIIILLLGFFFFITPDMFV